MRNWLYISRKDKKTILILAVILIILGSISTYNAYIERSKKEDNAENKSQGSFYTYKLPQLDSFSHGNGNANHNGKLDLNIADFDDLLLTLAIDSTVIRKMLYYKRAIRGYNSLNQLIEVDGIDANLLKKIAQKTYVAPNMHDKICINQESFESLLQHPYLNYKQCAVIVDIRERKGNIKTMKRLRMLSEFTERDLKRLEPYLSFDMNENLNL